MKRKAMELNTRRLIDELSRNNMKQRDLADIIGVTEVSVSRYVNGKRTPRKNILIKMAEALQTTPGFLTDFVDDESHEYASYEVMMLINTHGKNWRNKTKIMLIKKLLEIIQ